MSVPLKAQLLLADDHAMVRRGLRLILDAEPDLDVIAEAGDGAEAVEQVLRNDIHLAILDVSMPKLTGLQAAREIAHQRPDVRMLMLSMHDEDARIVAAVQAGACGYVLKDADHHEFLRIIRATARGEQVQSPFMPDRFAKQVMSAIHTADGARGTGVMVLTEREREILACAASGRGNKEIADQLCLSPDTVKTHLHHIYQKLGVAGRVEAILAYIQSR